MNVIVFTALKHYILWYVTISYKAGPSVDYSTSQRHCFCTKFEIDQQFKEHKRNSFDLYYSWATASNSQFVSRNLKTSADKTENCLLG